jgi:anti-sigma factor RsiW
MSGFLHRIGFRLDHRWAPWHMSSYIDGELTPHSRGRIERHLGECAECRRVLAELRATLDALHQLSAPSDRVDPAVLVATVRGRLD